MQSLLETERPVPNASIFPKWRELRHVPRFECDEYTAFIKTYGCLICHKNPTPHHYYEKGRAGNHASDLLQIPLCLKHHDELHKRFGSNATFERHYALHFQSTIVRLLKKWFHAKGWEWQDFESLIALETFVHEQLHRV